MDRQATVLAMTQLPTGPIDCACVIHGDAYDWSYVQRLYNMLNRHVSAGVRMHVYTEHDRPVPAPMIKHQLEDWGISGPKKSWWYKMQLFDPQHHAGPLLYFDLDVVIVQNIDWMWNQSLKYLWAVRDFKYLWRPTHYGVNSSIMWWDTRSYEHVWNNFKTCGIKNAMQRWHGDQDFITEFTDENSRRFFDQTRVQSWRWQCKDGGYNFKKRIFLAPNTGTVLTDRTSVVIFHGKPKPAELTDSVIVQHWL